MRRSIAAFHKLVPWFKVPAEILGSGGVEVPTLPIGGTPTRESWNRAASGRHLSSPPHHNRLSLSGRMLSNAARGLSPLL